MKGFRFTLEAVRTLRLRQEHLAMERYAQMTLARQRALERLAEAQRNLEAGWHELRGRLEAGCPAGDAAQAHQFHRALGRRREECAAALGLAERRLNAAMHSLLIARQQREVVDKCFDTQKTRHERELLRGEQKLADELASRRGNHLLSRNQTEAFP